MVNRTAEYVSHSIITLPFKDAIMKTAANICTIYLLTNSINQKIYVGQTWLSLHGRMGKNGSNYQNSTYLYNAIQKYGSNKFYYEVLAQCSDQKSADYLEDYYINLYNSRNSEIGYNLKEGGSAGKHSEGTKQKISDTLKTQAAAWTPEEKAKRAEPISGYWEGKERGPQTEEHKALVVKTLEPGGFVGHHHTEEAKSNISQKNKGRRLDPVSVARGAKKREMPIEKQMGIIQAYQDGMTIDKIQETFETRTSGIYRVLDSTQYSQSQ